MAPMQLEIQRDNDKIVVHLNGDLNGSGANKVVHALQRIHGGSKEQTIVLDLSAIHK